VEYTTVDRWNTRDAERWLNRTDVRWFEPPMYVGPVNGEQWPGARIVTGRQSRPFDRVTTAVESVSANQRPASLMPAWTTSPAEAELVVDFTYRCQFWICLLRRSYRGLKNFKALSTKCIYIAYGLGRAWHRSFDLVPG